MKVEKDDNTFSLLEADELLKRYREVRKAIDPYRTEVIVRVKPSDFPLKEVDVGDLHYGHEHADPKAIDRAIEHAGDDGMLVLHGNIIDAANVQFARNNVSRIVFDTQQQAFVVRRKFDPIFDGGRGIAVGKNGCHEGWGPRNALLDPNLLIYPNGPILYTGGLIRYVDGRGKVLATHAAFHNPGAGNTGQSPEGALRRQSKLLPDEHQNSADINTAGHTHRLTAGQDVRNNPVTGRDRKTAFAVVGTAKGTIDHPDDFLIERAVPPSYQPADTADEGVMTVYRSPNGGDGKSRPYPVAGLNRGERMYDAFWLLENATRVGAAEDITRSITESPFGESPRVRFDKRRSEFNKPAVYDRRAGEEPVYQRTSHKIETHLPISVQFMGGLRQGSSSFREGRFGQIMDEVAGNDWAYFIATRRLVDVGVSNHWGREGILDDLIQNLKRGGERSLLGFMRTDELLNLGWTVPVADDYENLIKPLVPSDYLSQTLKAPAMMPQTVSELRLRTDGGNGVDYLILGTDRLRRFTSVINPFHGLTRMAQEQGMNADVYVGGHTEEGGWRTWLLPGGKQLETVVPLGFSGFIEKGAYNEQPYPEGGQGCVFDPNKRSIYSFACHDDVRDGHRALWMLSGLEQMGELDTMKRKLKKRK